MPDVLRVANCSGFYGDRLAAAREMVEGGPIDFLTGDYLAELTLLILAKARDKDPTMGYARTFLTQLEEVAVACREREIRIVVNAGGLNPAGLAEAARAVHRRLGVEAVVAHIEGDDLTARLRELGPLAHMDTGRSLAEVDVPILSANAYLGAWGIVAALERGADVVICPRVTDAALVLGPAAWCFDWARDDWDRLASAVVAGHVIECGPQCTGGNYALFREVPGLEHPGFPVAEIREDGSFVITKHPGTGGLVSVGTVTAQLLYEIAGPRYPTPDVTARFDTVRVEQEGPDRVHVTGVRGEPPPATTKICINYRGGFCNSMTFVLTGLDVEEKAQLIERSLADALAACEESAVFPRGPYLTVSVRDRDQANAGRAFAARVVELALASYPGLYLTSPPGNGSEIGVYWPALVPSSEIDQRVVVEGESLPIAPTPVPAAFETPTPPMAPGTPSPGGPLREAPLGLVAGARSGDKGGNANIGFWVRSDAAYSWLSAFLTVERLRELLPEARALPVDRYELPNLLALNFVVRGLLGEGVGATLRPDPQAKSLGEALRAQVVPIPEALL